MNDRRPLASWRPWRGNPLQDPSFGLFPTRIVPSWLQSPDAPRYVSKETELTFRAPRDEFKSPRLAHENDEFRVASASAAAIFDSAHG
jgi:hypothetical protein